ncbi:flavin reductase family protein [Streptomyces sodiiphilus]|uniref:flavin reductase family protein n=1 Tax=Streptomyces sodiiphilus TaxID=226217 RepID=UPI0031D8FF0C
MEPSVSPERFRATLGRFPTGVVAVTALRTGDASPAGLALNSFAPVSLDPPLVLFRVAHTSTSWPRLRTAESFCVNILGEGRDLPGHELSLGDQRHAGRSARHRRLRASPVRTGGHPRSAGRGHPADLSCTPDSASSCPRCTSRARIRT